MTNRIDNNVMKAIALMEEAMELLEEANHAYKAMARMERHAAKENEYLYERATRAITNGQGDVFFLRADASIAHAAMAIALSEAQDNDMKADSARQMLKVLEQNVEEMELWA